MSGSWIFLSHSSKDIKTVRKIRNEFEECGHNPLAFHLKCLSSDTDSGKREIYELLKREIDARDWFVFCESEHSRQSEYVRFERDYIHRSGKSKIWTLDVSNDWAYLKRQIDSISKDLKICLQYHYQDSKIGAVIEYELRKKDFDVWIDRKHSSHSGDSWRDKILLDLSDNSYYGLTIRIISKHEYMPALRDEFEYITKNVSVDDAYITVFVHGYSIDKEVEVLLRRFPSFDLPENAELKDYYPLLDYIDIHYTNDILHKP